MAKKNTSSEKSQKSKESPENSMDSVMKNKTVLYAIIGAAVLVFAATVLFTSNDGSEQQGDQQEQQSVPEQNADDTAAPPQATSLISFKQPTWGSDIQSQCKSCVDSPAGCSQLEQVVAYSCMQPEELPAKGTWSCTRKVTGEKTGSTTKGSCSTEFNNYIKLRPDQTTEATICCTYSYTEDGQKKESEEYCGTQTYAYAC